MALPSRYNYGMYIIAGIAIATTKQAAAHRTDVAKATGVLLKNQ